MMQTGDNPRRDEEKDNALRLTKLFTMYELDQKSVSVPSIDSAWSLGEHPLSFGLCTDYIEANIS